MSTARAHGRRALRKIAAVTEPRAIDFSAVPPVSHDPGVGDRDAHVDGTRWALVEYSPGSGRAEWCDTPHAGFVVSGKGTGKVDTLVPE